MRELLRTNDPVLLSFLTSVLADADIRHTVTDQNNSVIDGSIGAIQRRILVADEQYDEARTLVADAQASTEPPASGGH